MGSNVQPSREMLEAVADAYVKANRCVSHAALGLGIPRATFQARLNKAAKLGLIPPALAPVIPGFEISRINTRYDKSGQIAGQSVQQKPEAGEAFTMPSGHVIKGKSSLLDPEGRVLAEWVKTREGPIGDWVEAIREAIGNIMAEAKPPSVPFPDDCDNDILTVYPIADPHLGLHAWAKQTGEAYNLKIACETIYSGLETLVNQARPSRRAIILWLGDTTHQNDRTNMTPRSGHVLDTDGRFQKVMAIAAELALQIGELAATKHQEVTIRFVEGNHDPEAAFALTMALSLYFRSVERITVDDSPSPHWYYRFGQVLIGATHGHTMKPDRMAMMMATDRAADWGETKHRHMLFGHVHHDSMKEIGGVKVESFNSPAAKDAFAHAGGWRSGRALTAITFHQERGEIGRHRVNIG